MTRRLVDSLRARGCLRFAKLVQLYRLGHEVECFCWVRVDLSRLEQAATILANQREVRYLSATIGYSDLICEAILRTQEDLYNFSTRTLGQLPGVRGADVGIELQTVKRAYLRMSTPTDDEDPGRYAVSSDGEPVRGHESRIVDRRREEH